MPNWCENQMWITTSNKDTYNKIKTHLETKPEVNENGDYKDVGLFGLLYPEPDYENTIVKHAFQDGFVEDKSQSWWDWRVTNWGTKWDVRSDDLFGVDFSEDDEHKEYIIELSFNTAWSPPLEWIQYCEEKYEAEGLKFQLNYFEGGMGFCGVYEDGHDTFFEFDDLKELKQNNKLFQKLDEQFGIGEYLEGVEE